MVLGNVYDILEVLELIPKTILIHYLRGATKKGGIYQWRELEATNLPEYLDRIKALPETNLGSWRQLQKSLKWLVMEGAKHQVCPLPEDWWIEINTRGHRFLFNSKWRNDCTNRVLGAQTHVGNGTRSSIKNDEASRQRSLLVNRLRCTTMDPELREQLIEEARLLSAEEVIQKGEEWQQIRKAWSRLHQLKRVLRDNGIHDPLKLSDAECW